MPYLHDFKINGIIRALNIINIIPKAEYVKTS